MGKYAHQRTATIAEYKPLRINALATSVTPVGIAVATTSSTVVGAPGSVTITPASMTGIIVGQRLNIAGGTGTAENVTVTAITGTTFTAVFANTHSGTYNITSVNGTLLGALVVNKAGDSTCVLTLYDGSPNAGGPQPVGKAFAVITNPVPPFAPVYGCTCDGGLFYTLTGVTAPELTLTYLDQLLSL